MTARISTAAQYIHSSFNNTIVTITDLAGNAISGRARSQVCAVREGDSLAAQLAAEQAARQLQNMECTVEVYVKAGSGRESAIRALETAGLEVVSIKDVTPIPHNGCRPPKRRRV